MDRTQLPELVYKTGQVFSNFVIKKIDLIPEIRAYCIQCEHEITKAGLTFIWCNDEESLYAVSFRTPAFDSTGAAHILEHSVLAGSKKYPLKDVFNELTQVSAASFLNAVTYPDRTMYPVCSTIKKDFFNLADVYTDVVLNPLLRKETFLQEGWHFELDETKSAGERLDYSGVVYNEMTGAYSTPEEYAYKILGEQLFPDTCYRHDSGGDPEFIPSLTWERFKDFHRRYYHPSNAEWILYGAIPLEEHCRFIDERIKDFGYLKPASDIALQKKFDAPKKLEYSYPAASKEDEGKLMYNTAWLFESMENTELTLALTIIADMLTGNSAGPLRKALIDSGIGEDLSDITGFSPYYKQPVFSVGLRGCTPGKFQDFMKIVMTTLEEVRDKGFAEDLLEASLHQAEFNAREITGSFPVKILDQLACFLTYGIDPVWALTIGKTLAEIREKLAKNPRYFQDLVRTWFLDNTHRVDLSGTGDADFFSKTAAKKREKLAEEEKNLDEAALEAIKKQKEVLLDYQNTPDTAETKALLPRLAFRDIPDTVSDFSLERDSTGTIPVTRKICFSNGITYLSFAFDLRDLTPEELTMLELAIASLTEMGAGSYSYDAMSSRVDRYTGGFSTRVTMENHIVSGELVAFANLEISALERNFGKLLEICKDIFTAPDASDSKHFADLVKEKANSGYNEAIQNGTQFSMFLASSVVSTASRANEYFDGISRVLFLREAAKGNKKDMEKLFARVISLRSKIFGRKPLRFHISGERNAVLKLQAMLGDCPSWFRDESVTPYDHAALPNLRRAIVLNTQVNYCAKAIAGLPADHEKAGILLFASSLTTAQHLYKKLRAQGGAYGAMCSYAAAPKLFFMGSYRDPRTIETFQDFDTSAEFLRDTPWTQEELDSIKPGILKNFDRPLSPKTMAQVSLMNDLVGYSDTIRRRLKQRVYTVTPPDIVDIALWLKEAWATAASALVCSKKTAGVLKKSGWLEEAIELD